MTKYLLVINYASQAIFSGVKKMRQLDEFAELELLILTNKTKAHLPIDNQIPTKVIKCDFDNKSEIEAAIQPFSESIVGVICRQDSNIQYLRKIVPFLPAKVLVASVSALQTATNKRLMRQAFHDKYPRITPCYLEVKNASDQTIKDVEQKLNYPLIVKPASLASSFLIQSCSTAQELKKALRKVFETIHEIYKREGRDDWPQVIVEEFMAGDLYSIDVYCLGNGRLFFCPPVGYVTGKQKGIDDFFLYQRSVPTNLSSEEIEQANQTAKEAIEAIGLEFSTVHVELVKTASGWQIIELGPRLGRFRHRMYSLAYGIDHSLNDIKIHLGLEPDISKKLRRYCAAYSIYPDQEGSLKSLQGLEKIKDQVTNLKEYKKPGDNLLFAKNGGQPIAEFIIVNEDQVEFERLAKYIDKTVKSVID